MNNTHTTLTLIKGPQRFVLIFDDDSRQAILQQITKWMNNPELPFTPYDASVLRERVGRRW